MIVEHFPVGALACTCTILGDPESGEAIVIDGGDDVDHILDRLRVNGLRASYLVHSHAHFDHIGAFADLRDRTGARGLLHPGDLPLYRALAGQYEAFGMGEAPRVVDLDADLVDGECITAGAIELSVHHTPGHTPGSSCFVYEHAGATTILSGDTLFRGAIGRWDIGGTSMEDIVASIREKLLPYDDATSVIPGHGPATTIGRERTTNPYLLA